ncbi:unnamed protein product [Leuciscus chuanchicus]
MPKSMAKKSQEYRDRIKADPVKYQQKLEKDRERYRRKKERGIVKPILEVSSKEKERKRKQWKINQQNRRRRIAIANAVLATTPPNSPQTPDTPPIEERSASRGRKKKYRLMKFAQRELGISAKFLKMTAKGAQTLKYNRGLQLNKISTTTEEKILNFLSRDENSRATTGKKETLKSNKTKMQKRFLNESMQRLHEKFLKEFPEEKISYSQFSKRRPFWVVRPRVQDRDTCLCKRHANTQFMADKLMQCKVINTNNVDDLMASLCCENSTKECMYRDCVNCKEKDLQTASFDGGPADGVGAAVKQKADRMVAMGKDISSPKTLFNELLASKTNIKLFFIENEEIDAIDALLPDDLQTVRGTMTIHQIVSESPGVISWSILSCLCSSPNGCSCFDPQVVTFQKEGSVALSQGPPAQHNTSTNVLQRIEEVNDGLTGNWCVVIYDGDAFPGIIQELDATDSCVLVKTMSGIGCNRFFWPMRDDVIWYEPDNVLGLIPEPTAVTKRHVQINATAWQEHLPDS